MKLILSQEKLEPRLGNRYKEDGSELEMPFNIPLYVQKLKKLPNQYLEKSVIIYNNSWIKYLLVLIFKIQKPVAPVYLISKDNYVEDIFNNLDNIKENIIEILP